MGKKVKRKTYVSKGQRNSVARGILKAVSMDVSPLDRALNKIVAWRAGKNPYITIANPSRAANQPFIRVRANELYGSPKLGKYNIYRGREEE